MMFLFVPLVPAHPDPANSLPRAKIFSWVGFAVHPPPSILFSPPPPPRAWLVARKQPGHDELGDAMTRQKEGGLDTGGTKSGFSLGLMGSLSISGDPNIYPRPARAPLSFTGTSLARAPPPALASTGGPFPPTILSTHH